MGSARSSARSRTWCWSARRPMPWTRQQRSGGIGRSFRAGAYAYVLKSAPKNELLAIIRSVHAGRKHIPAEIAARIAEHLGVDDLTARELEVLRLIRDGHRNK